MYVLLNVRIFTNLKDSAGFDFLKILFILDYLS